MWKLLLLLALIASNPAQSFAFCETYEPYCDDQQPVDDEESGDPQRPADPDGPDYPGDDYDV